MTVIHTYNTLKKKVRQVIPTGHAYRERNLAWFMTGVFHSNSVHLSKVANKIPGKAKRRSRTRRLNRFLNNSSVRVRKWYKPVATRLLQEAAKTGLIRLIIDTTKVAQNHQLIMVAVAYKSRALPIVWTWIKSGRGHSSGSKQIALLRYARSLVPSETRVVVLGDSEFTPLQTLLQKWNWFYVLRQKGSHLYRQTSDDTWQRLDTLVTKPKERRWLSNAELTKKHQRTCNLFAHWKRGEKEPWLLATNFSTFRKTNRFYKKKMWLDEMFGDFKSNGADLEKSRLRHFLRLSRLTLVVALLYVWLVAFGSTTIKKGERHLVDRADRKDLSVYRIGYDMFERCLINNLPIKIRDSPYFI